MAESEPNSKIAWITGAGRGIGKALAIRLAKDGWHVAISSRTVSELSIISEQCNAGRIYAYPLDVTDDIATLKTIKKIEKNLGAIQLAVLNAGTYFPMPLEHFSIKNFRSIFETNLVGPANGLAHLIPRFISRKSGKIAVVSSLAGYSGLPYAAGYGATKAALINMCESLKPELDNHSVKIYLVNPGFVKTSLTDKNDFFMPFLISAEEAANIIASGLKKDKFEISFPKKFSILMKIIRILPYRLYFFLTKWIVQ